MSTLTVEICEVKEVLPHPNADLLEIIRVKGWNVIVQKSLGLKVGSEVVYFPPDSVMSEELANRLGILKYLSSVRCDGAVIGYKVRAARLRGEPSYGTIDHIVPAGFQVEQDLKDYYGVTQYEPRTAVHGDNLASPFNFATYTDIENIRNFPDILQEGEEVEFTEKLHGSNCRVGYIMNGDGQFEFMAGSHSVRRKELSGEKKSDFWLPLDDPNIRRLLVELSETADDRVITYQDVIIFCELIGSGVQDMTYGYKMGSRGYRAFDIYAGGSYLDVDMKQAIFEHYQISSAPIVYRGPFTWAKLEEHTYGNTLVCPPEQAGKFKGREGVVITPVQERRDPKVGRVIFKSISADYLARKGGTDQ